MWHFTQTKILPNTVMGSPTRLPGFIWCGRILGLCSILSGPLVLRLCRSHWPLPRGRCSLRSWQHICGVLSGSSSRSSFCATMLLLSRSLNRAPLRTLSYASDHLLLVVRHSFSFTSSSVLGKANPEGDALSSFQSHHFRQLVPHADQEATVVPQYFLACLLVVWSRDESCS